MPELMRLKKPVKQKLLIGFSDISSLHLWLNQIWQWPSLHGPSARQAALGKIDARDIATVHQLCFEGLENYIIPDLLPLNASAQQQNSITGIATGGCISILQNSIGTPWQIDTKNKILFLEDVNEPAYRIDRALVHLANAGLLRQVKAIVFGDFGERAIETEQLDWVLTESIPSYLTQQSIDIPLFRLRGFGHGTRNKPLPFGVTANITTQGTVTQLTFK
jgi:muramoyltetrapeptide carboxypeptidase